MGDVGKRSAVNETGSVFKGLDKVRFDGIFEKGGHCTLCLKVACVENFSAAAVADDDFAEPVFEVGDVGCKTEDGHDLRGDGDHEVVFTGNSVGWSSHTDDQIPQGTVVHVEAAFEDDAARVDVKGISLLDMVVDHGAEQVVGGGDCVNVTGEVEVNVLHRNNLCISSSGSSAFDAKDGAKRWFAKCNDGVFAYLCHGFSDTDGGGGLSFAGRGRIDSGYENEFSGRVDSDSLFERVGKFCFILSVGFQFVRLDAEFCSDCGNLLHVGLLCDFNVGKHGL